MIQFLEQANLYQLNLDPVKNFSVKSLIAIYCISWLGIMGNIFDGIQRPLKVRTLFM